VTGLGAPDGGGAAVSALDGLVDFHGDPFLSVQGSAEGGGDGGDRVVGAGFTAGSSADVAGSCGLAVGGCGGRGGGSDFPRIAAGASLGGLGSPGGPRQNEFLRNTCKG
jgi:hypothetical protein